MLVSRDSILLLSMVSSRFITKLYVAGYIVTEVFAIGGGVEDPSTCEERLWGCSMFVVS